MGQQFYVIRRNPAPGTPAYDAWEARRKAKGKADVALAAVVEPEAAPEVAAPNPSKVARQQPRQQPKKQTRSQRKR
jgi:YidC/Oxa1 family membrane protein insertase